MAIRQIAGLTPGARTPLSFSRGSGGVLPARTNGGIRAPEHGQERARPSSQATGGVIGPLFTLLRCAFGRAPGHPVVAGRPRPWGFGPLVLL